MMVAKFFLCMLLCHVACRCAIARQTDTLDKLIFDPINLKRVAGYGDITTSTSSDYSVVESRIYPQDGLKEKDMISKLPGQPEGVNFDQYGGYITVDENAGRALFYYFAEAPKTTQKSSKPLLLWLNGGPGCSSLGYGAMAELGPFRVMSDGKTLFRNPYAWNDVANVLFLESPAGVGFSYSNTTTDYEASGDRKTAEDSYIFLVNWLERFPEYKGRDFFITGESYAGHYVPQLADTILYHNRLVVAGTAKGTVIHLKGIMIGNAVINDETDGKGMYDYFWTHALISDEVGNGIHKYCKFLHNAIEGNQQCVDAILGLNIGNINIYNIYAPRCSTSGATPTTVKRYSMENFDPCTDGYVTAYLNNVEVQESLHAKKFNYSWSSCSSLILNWLDSPSTVLPLLKEFIANDIRVWVYSGDIDGRVPVTSTRYSLNELKLLVKPEYEWRPWSINNEVGGYTFTYEGNLTFVTVRGAGHEVPSYQPLRALALVKSFVEGKSLPN